MCPKIREPQLRISSCPHNGCVSYVYWLVEDRQGKDPETGAHEAQNMEPETGIRSVIGWRKAGDSVELMKAAVLLGNGRQRNSAAEAPGLRGRQVLRTRRHRRGIRGTHPSRGI